MDDLVGYITLGLSVLFTGGMLLVGWLSWRKKQPTKWYRGVGIRYVQGAQPGGDDWEGLHAQIDAFWQIAERDHPKDAVDFMSFWVDVVPPDGEVTGFLAPNKKLNGTVDYISLYGLFKKTYVMVVRQPRAVSGKIMPAHTSALAHEVIEHLWAFKLYGNWGTDADRSGGPITLLGKGLLVLKKEAVGLARENTR
jgi:hypothetical protein